jgi:uncharacterized protein (DUF433 family)
LEQSRRKWENRPTTSNRVDDCDGAGTDVRLRRLRNLQNVCGGRPDLVSSDGHPTQESTALCRLFQRAVAARIEDYDTAVAERLWCLSHTFFDFDASARISLAPSSPVDLAPSMSAQRAHETNLLDRITINPDQCGGRPCIRGMRIRVKEVLELLAAGETHEHILADYPYLEQDDIFAALRYAARHFD